MHTDIDFLYYDRKRRRTMTYEEVLEEARKNMAPKCRVCPECNGLACGNMIPGPGSIGPGNGANDNWRAWKEYRLNMNTMMPNTPVDTSCEFFGRKLALPLLTGPIGSIRLQFRPTDDIRDYNEKCIAACREAGILACFGDGLTEGVLEKACADSKANEGVGIPIFNPFSQEEIISKIEMANQAGTAAVGVVVDSAAHPMLKNRPDAGTKTPEQLRELKEHAACPFIVKGIMNAECALKAAEAGADAIIVSNHGGRVLPYAPATADVLPGIADAVRASGAKTKIVVDGGIRSGYDILKAIALGADAVMICRPFLISYYGGGQEGIGLYFEKLKKEFSDTMLMCGARKISDISREMVLRF